MDEIKKDLEKIYRLVKDEAEKTGNIVIVDKKQTLECLKNIKGDIDKKYKETLKLWKKSVKLYSEFMKKAPGSRQMKPPNEKPSLPESVDTVKGYIDFFKSISNNKVRLNVKFIESMYLNSVRGISDMRAKRDAMMISVSGLATGAYYTG